MKRNYTLPAAIVALALVFGAPIAASAKSLITGADIKNGSISRLDLGVNSVASGEVLDNSLTSADIKNSTLTGADVKDKSLTTKDLSDATVKSLRGQNGTNGTNGVDGTDGVDGEDGIVSPDHKRFGAYAVPVGGKFAENAKMAGRFTMKAGKYLITTDALFRSNQATSGNSSLQVAVRGADGSTWGSDLGTGFTGSSPEQANREVTTSTTRVVSLDKDTVVTIYVFGYENNGQGSADSGKFDAEVYFTAVPVQ